MLRRATLVAALVLTAGVARAAGPEAVSFETTDGFTLRADFWRAADAKAPLAILLHQFNLDRRSFQPLVPALQERGFSVLALDQRGQGESKRQRTAGGERSVDLQALPRDAVGAFVTAGPNDVAAALAFLARRAVATDRVVLVGSSYGCTVSLLTAAAEKRVRGVALLSPGADYFGVDVLEAAKSYPGPLLAVAAEDDPVKASPPAARAIGQAHAGPEQIRILPEGGHGVSLLAAHPALAGEIAAFLASAAAAP